VRRAIRVLAALSEAMASRTFGSRPSPPASSAGLTYIENEPIGRVRTIPLYNESYRLLTSPQAMFGEHLISGGRGQSLPGLFGIARQRHANHRAAAKL
jgi:hypothetical protein